MSKSTIPILDHVLGLYTIFISFLRWNQSDCINFLNRNYKIFPDDELTLESQNLCALWLLSKKHTKDLWKTYIWMGQKTHYEGTLKTDATDPNTVDLRFQKQEGAVTMVWQLPWTNSSETMGFLSIFPRNFLGVNGSGEYVCVCVLGVTDWYGGTEFFCFEPPSLLSPFLLLWRKLGFHWKQVISRELPC